MAIGEKPAAEPENHSHRNTETKPMQISDPAPAVPTYPPTCHGMRLF
uniref:Uncharacterized protein n=1 Tax=Anguilla anguilla TaxID=7936 RepID=A0A0E9WAU3_ANGAN